MRRPAELNLEKPIYLSEAQREAYFENGYLLLESVVSATWLGRLREATERVAARASTMTESDKDIELEPGHTPEAPRLRRLTQPAELDPTFWEFGSQSVIVDIAADLIGPNVKYHHSNLNFKWHGGAEVVKWHQDVPFWPHTNFTPLGIGVYLDDVGPDQAPVEYVPGSHKGPIFSHFDADDVWVGVIGEDDVAHIAAETAVTLEGPAGSVTVHNCRTVHGSGPNRSDRSRPLLLYAYSAANAFAYTAHNQPRPHNGDIVRGEPARFARFDLDPCPVPPDWSKTAYQTIFAAQQEEVLAKRAAGE